MPAAAKSSFRINVELNLQTRKAERPSETEWQKYSGTWNSHSCKCKVTWKDLGRKRKLYSGT